MRTPPKRKCPNDDTEMLVTWDGPTVIAFICPVCKLERTHDQFHEKLTDVLHKPEGGKRAA